MKRLIAVYGVTCIFLILGAFRAGATTIVLPTDEQLIAKTDVIVEGTVVSSSPVELGGRIWTESIITVHRALKGGAAPQITVREIGGEIGDRITKIYGTPEFQPGERVLLFLERDPAGRYRTVDLFVGKFREGRALNGQRLWLREGRDDVRLLDADFAEIDPAESNIQRDAAGFTSFVEERIAGRPGRRNYGVVNPVLEENVQPERGGITSNFTLISEPTVYRWSRFDSGQPATWYSSGSQPGYADGGVGELRTGMASWNDYAAANIRYSYAGTRSGSLGGLNAPNGVNEVLLNDPLNEIAGTFSGSGTVGIGGFNGVSGSTNWNAPFTADASHTGGTKRATTIVEGNLTIQDGVTGSRISSGRLAEILAHEFGHTLGFGHSADSTALMYYTVTGRGPSLRADDQTAARWLYPNGSTPEPTPQPPAAPSSLNGAVSGTSIDLTWNDNASNETGQSVWLAAGSGSFGKVTDVGANVRSARISGLAPNTYRIYVIAYNGAGNSSPSNTTTQTIASAPVTPAVSAAFDVSPSAASTGETVRFTDRSSGSPTRWAWSFGDGTTSTAQHPQRAYSGPGTYTVTLTASNATSSSTASRTITVSSSMPYRTLVSAAAQTNGAGGTVWRTELTIFNAGSQSANIDLLYIPAGGGGVRTRAVYLAPRQTVTYANALVELFSISSGSGAIAIEATSAGATPRLHVTNRTFTNRSGGGTYGQSVPNVATSALERTFFLTGMRATPRYRTNAGLVNRSSAGVPVTLTLLGPTGSVLATKSMTLAGNSFQQSGLAQLFPSIEGQSHEVLSMRINAAADDAVSVYASVIDNDSQDPTYLQAVPGAAGSELTIPVVGRAPGANGTYWRTDVTMFNPTTSRLTLTLRYDGATKSVPLDGEDTVVLADVLSQFGRTSGTGALRVSWSGSSGPLVTSRTYTTTTTGGTFGQSIDPVQSLGNSAFVPGLRNDGSYRSNIGFVNGGNEPEVFQVILISQYGSELGRKELALGAGAQTQTALTALFPSAPPSAFTIQIAGDSNARLFAYGSMVDNISGDPVFFAGQ